ncbi:MAG TPA: hypothetical protein VLK29_00205 [Luteimonas sp.]|nr:hypothetical protein [Luteimonas sp.]
MRYRRCLTPLPFLLAAIAVPLHAQETVLQAENVRTEYAQVLRAEPVYQVLHATSMVERCGQSTPVDDSDQRRGISRVVGAVKDVLTPEPEPAEGARADDCRMVPVDREFRRPIAYDVDYIHKGVRYRSRLPHDPGNRVRVRVSVTPVLPRSAPR